MFKHKAKSCARKRMITFDRKSLLKGQQHGMFGLRSLNWPYFKNSKRKKKTWISGVRVNVDEATKMPEQSEICQDIGGVSGTVDAASVGCAARFA